MSHIIEYLSFKINFLKDKIHIFNFIFMQTILIIEDNHAIAESLKLYLQNSDFTIFLHFTGEHAVEKVAEVKPDLIILDINLPVMNGIAICSEIRKTLNTPIIILTARNSELDKITGLEL